MPNVTDDELSEIVSGFMGTSALDSEKSGLRCIQDTLTKNFKGLQHSLLTLAQGFKTLMSAKRRAQKAHARRKRRQASRVKGVENQPSRFPTDSPMGKQQDASTVDIGKRSNLPADHPQIHATVEGNGRRPAEAGTQPPIEDWAPSPGVSQGSGWGEEGLGQSGPTVEPWATGDPVEAGDSERPRESKTSPSPGQVLPSPDDIQSSSSETSEYLDIPKEVNIKKRDACRLIRALIKVSYELRGSRPEKRKPERRVYRAFVTLEDQVGIHHLSHRVGIREELQTTLQHPHQFRKTLIRVDRLKNLRWSLLRTSEDGNLTRMPELLQILEDHAEYVLRIEDQKPRRPNTPGTSKRHDFERASQKRGRQDFTWSPD
jgi:hypothetical protein